MLDQVAVRVGVFFEKFIGFMQSTGIVFMAILALIGLLLFLISGKNPIMKRLGIMMSVIFGLFIFVFAYMPVLYYYYTGGGPVPADLQVETIYSSTNSWFAGLFHVLMIIGTPITITVMLLGLLVRGIGVNNPMSKRRGIGLVLVSPMILFIIYIMPRLLHLL